MLRLFYRWVLRFHPARFRERFAEEMLSIFDHVEGRAAAAKLVADAFISLVRQWTMRSEYWEEKAAASVTVGAGGLPVFYTLESFKPRKSWRMQRRLSANNLWPCSFVTCRVLWR